MKATQQTPTNATDEDVMERSTEGMIAGQSDGLAALRRAHAEWLLGVAEHPYRFDFYQVLRHFEAAHPNLPRLGEARRPADEPLRVAQPADLSFAPAPLHSMSIRAEGPPVLSQRIFGLVGPNGPLPIHMTELARERTRQHGDPALQRFLDLLTHRFALLFYRAWAQAQPVVGLDRPGDAGFARRLGALAGLGSEPALQRDAAGDASKLHVTGLLARHVRDADGLLAWCRSQFDAPLRIAQWCGHWMPLAPDERSRLGDRAGQGLGQGAVIGASVWDVQHKFRIVMGPLRLDRYLSFLPGATGLSRLQAMVRQWVGLEFEWDLQLVLHCADVPRLQLAQARPAALGRLGRTAWLGQRRRATDAADLVLNVERTLQSLRARKSSNAGPAPSH
jgi:type VI secretion system protein ImpH